MDQGRICEIGQFLREQLESNGLSISSIILFGSMADGTDSEESDVDLAIVSDSFKGKDLFERNKLIKQGAMATLKKFLVPIEIITITSDELQDQSRLISGYINKGIPLSLTPN